MSASIAAVALLCPWWPGDMRPNGIISYGVALADALRRAGVRVFVLARKAEGHVRDEDVIVLDDPGLAEPGRRGVLTRVALRIAPEQYKNHAAARVLLRVLRRLHAQHGVALLEMEESFGLPAVVAPRSPVPVIVRAHGPWGLIGPAQGAPQDARFERRVRREGAGFAAAHGISSPSRHVRGWLGERYALDSARVRVIPNPAPLVPVAQRWRLEECDPQELLFVGRFDRVKGADTVLEAFARVLQARPRLRLRFAGPDGQITDERGAWDLNGMVRALLPNGAAGRVAWLGPVASPNVAALRRQAFMTIIASRFENFPLVGLEALAQGCPIVSTSAGGLAEIFTHNRNALLCNPADPDGLAAGILALLADPWRAARLGGQAARDAEERFAPDLVARQTLKFYERVLEHTVTDRAGKGVRT